MLPESCSETPAHEPNPLREAPTGIDSGDTGTRRKTQPPGWQSLIRQPLEIGFHLTLDNLLTQLEHWITDHTR